MKRTNRAEIPTPIKRTKTNGHDVVEGVVVEPEYVGTPFNPKRGHPTDYREGHVHMARQLCLLCHALDEVATIEMLANFFSVTDTTIKNWMADHEDFFAVIKDGRQKAGGEVVMSLFKKALGYDYLEVRRTMNSAGKEMNRVETLKHIAGDTGAICFALKNWAPDYWKERKQLSSDPDHPLIPKSTQLNVSGLDDQTLALLMSAVAKAADEGDHEDAARTAQPTLQ